MNAKSQRFNLFNGVLIGDDYEESARQRLREKGTSNPTPNKLACCLKDMIKEDLIKILNATYIEKEQPDH